jgi:hypothetical protein
VLSPWHLLGPTSRYSSPTPSSAGVQGRREKRGGGGEEEEAAAPLVARGGRGRAEPQVGVGPGRGGSSGPGPWVCRP